MKDCLTRTSEIMSIVTGFIAIIAFLGIYKFVDIFKWIKIYKIQKVCKNPFATPLSIIASEAKSEFDKDFLLLNNRIHWIKNHETLRFIMKNNSKFNDINSQKSYKSYFEIDNYERGFDLNIIYE